MNGTIVDSVILTRLIDQAEAAKMLCQVQEQFEVLVRLINHMRDLRVLVQDQEAKARHA